MAMVWRRTTSTADAPREPGKLSCRYWIGVPAGVIDRDALTAWLPPDGMQARFARFDARPGGSYRLILTYADASATPGKATADSDIVEARFVDIVPGVRVVQAVDFASPDPAYTG